MIAVCTPARDTMHATFVYDLAQMLRTLGDRALFATAQGSILPNLRATLVRAALAAEPVTHVLFLDSDMRFEPSLADRLLHEGVAVISALAVTKDGQRRPVGADLPPPRGVTVAQVERVGLAATLIERQVFERVAEPWFSFTWDATNGKMAGEDVWFCDRARAEGFQPHLHYGVEVGHSGQADHYFSGVSIP